jgi:hypothetical protein
MTGTSEDDIRKISEGVSSLEHRLKEEVIASKVRLAHELRTAIAYTTRIMTEHSKAVVRGA